ncbi:MAG: aminopeptidase family protein P, partial [Proteobacteria bacterium]|nr:aminopeptidase family protein P [Pseudomonadota bacterium]
EYSGESTDSKLEKIIKDLDPKSDVLILNHPASICWLLNIRSSDVQYTPLSLCYAAIHRRGVKVELFIDEKRLNKQIKQYLPNLRVISPDKLSERILSFKQKEAYQNVQIDGNHSNYWLYSTITNAGLKVIDKADPCLIHKACKNETEINETIKAHEIDGLAVTKFLFWLNESVKKGAEISEISASDKLLELRKQSADFLYPSFASISGFGSNGAVIHYCATQKTNKKITGNSLYLIDSGGQYPFGTTDITRTVAIGKPTEEQIEDFTRVLKGHIALARAKFPVGVTGNSLDALARYQLWQAEKDYDHGTGHGVGSFLSVHEGPQSISKRASTTALKEGMIISNEPGYYKAGEYGIRIENLVLVQKLSDKFLHFKTITLAPIDPSLINFKMMTYPEKKWLKNYHQEIYDKLASKLNNDERNWLKKTVELYEI